MYKLSCKKNNEAGLRVPVRSMGPAVLLLMCEVAALLRQVNEVGEDHPTEADVVERGNGIGFDVFVVIIIEATLDGVLHITDGEVWLQVGGQFRHLHSLDPVVEIPQSHSRFSG